VEQAVLGGLMLDETAWDRVTDLLQPGDFFRHDHRLIFEAVGQVVEQNRSPDIVTVGEVLERQGVLAEVGGNGYLATLVNITPTTANITHHAQKVRERAFQRQVMKLGEDLRAGAGSTRSPEELQGLLDQYRKALEALEAESAPPFEDPATLAVDDMLDTPPPARRWLVDGFLPLGVVGVLAAGGGTGKSMLLLQLAIAVATGRPFLGMDVGEPGGVLVLAAEDDRAELHRRFQAILDQLKRDGEWTPKEEELVRERMLLAPKVGSDNRLVIEQDGQVVATGRHQQIARQVANLPVDVNLLVLDPASRFRSGPENNNDAATRFVEVLEDLRAETGATVLLSHHASKEGLTADADRLGAEILRGASGLVDGVRWAAAMASLRPEAAQRFGVAAEEADRFVRMDVVKANYGSRWSGTWLHRQSNGVLTPTPLTRAHRKKPGPKPEDVYGSVLPSLLDLVREHEEKETPLTRRGLRYFAGRDGRLGVGDQKLRKILDQALAEGHVVESPAEGGRNELRLPVG
jgi:RecA-family ATPase